MVTDATAHDVAAVVNLVRNAVGSHDYISVDKVDGHVVVHVQQNGHHIDSSIFEALSCVDSVDESEVIYGLAGSDAIDPESGYPLKRQIEIPTADVKIGSDEFVVIAGPCAVENEGDLLKTARMVKSFGVKLLRGGAFKPRTSPYSFQGLGEEGLRILGLVRKEVGIGVVTEAMEPATVGMVSEVSDIIQIGSRNMQNFPLLKEVGRQPKPVLLKRGMSATLDEWLGAAEYILNEGNQNVILCERGIRTFSLHSRHTLDLSVIPSIRELSGLPVIVDPSHSTGSASKVPAMAKASLAAGADGLLIEVHPDPSRALSDGFQTLTLDQFGKLMTELKAVAGVLGRAM
jgi:3-deoxy-7-phosphoheptulonate synthase